MAGRTLLQQAVPTTFGLKAAGWLVALDEATARLVQVRDTRLAVQLGGAAGTLASLGADGVEVVSALARELGLAEPVAPWHTDRTRPAELAGALGAACGVVAKVAQDVVLLSQTEVAEVREGGEGTRRLLDDAAQAQPRRRRLRPGVRAPGAGPGGDAAGRDGARARARRGRLARRVAAARASCCGRPARRSPGCATASSTWRSTPSGCAPTSTSPAASCWPSA